MKLVDILARELKVWPEGAVEIDQSAIDRELYAYGDGEVLSFTNLYMTEFADDVDEKVTREQWQAAVDALKQESPALHVQILGRGQRGQRVLPWDGEGLPPAGLVCMVKHPAQTSRKVKILSHWEDGFKAPVAIYIPLEGTVHCDQAIAECFRPIRTAEQIAAEEREQACRQICLDAGSPEQTRGQMETAYRLYDAGYRKQPK